MIIRGLIPIFWRSREGQGDVMGTLTHISGHRLTCLFKRALRDLYLLAPDVYFGLTTSTMALYQHTKHVILMR